MAMSFPSDAPRGLRGRGRRRMSRADDQSGRFRLTGGAREPAVTAGDRIDIGVFDLTAEPIRRNHSNRDITAARGGNFRRLLGQMWG